MAAFDATQSQDVGGPVLRPEHSRLLATRADDRLATRLHDSGADEVTGFAVSAVLHSPNIVLEIEQRLGRGLGAAFSKAPGLGLLDDRFDAVLGVRRELLLMQIKQNSFSKSRILFTLGVASDSS